MKYKTTLTIILLAFAQLSFGQQYAERNLFRGSYAVKGIKTVEIINKYGSIHVNNWEKDSIQISTDVYLSASSLKKLEKLKKGINVKYSESDFYLHAETSFGAYKTSFAKELQDISRSLTPGTEKRIEINYEIYVPKGVNVKIINQYGDVFLGALHNKVEVKLSNGSFKASNLEEECTLDFNFVNAMINDLRESSVKLNYSTLNLKKAINLNYESTSSELYADEVSIFKYKANRDKINIGKLDYAYGSASYTSVKIAELGKEIDGYFTYGQVNISKMATTVQLIDIDSERTDIKLYIPNKINYSYDILYNINADLIMPEEQFKPMDNLETEEMKAVKGIVGKKPTMDIRIRALKRCLIQINNIN